jgi:hypothetical protein
MVTMFKEDDFITVATKFCSQKLQWAATILYSKIENRDNYRGEATNEQQSSFAVLSDAASVVAAHIEVATTQHDELCQCTQDIAGYGDIATAVAPHIEMMAAEEEELLIGALHRLLMDELTSTINATFYDEEQMTRLYDLIEALRTFYDEEQMMRLYDLIEAFLRATSSRTHDTTGEDESPNTLDILRGTLSVAYWWRR